MMLFVVPAVADPMSVNLLNFIDPAVPPETQGAQLTVFKIADHFNGFKNVFESHGPFLKNRFSNNIQMYTKI